MLNAIILIIVGVLCFREGYKAGKKRYIKKFEKIIKKKLDEEYVLIKRDNDTNDDIVSELFS